MLFTFCIFIITNKPNQFKPMTKIQSAQTLNKVVRLSIPIPENQTVFIFSTYKGIFYKLPQGMDGIAFKKFREAHTDEINDWLKILQS